MIFGTNNDVRVKYLFWSHLVNIVKCLTRTSQSTRENQQIFVWRSIGKIMVEVLALMMIWCWKQSQPKQLWKVNEEASNGSNVLRLNIRSIIIKYHQSLVF